MKMKMKKMRLQRGSRPYAILGTLLRAGGFILISTFSPKAGATIFYGVLREYFRKRRFQKEILLRDLRRLQMRELLTYQELPDGTVRMSLTRRGKETALAYNLDEMQLKKPDAWDGKWRMVMFDIPYERKQARDALRDKLKQWGMYRLQKSVFITPYECENEIDFAGTVFEVRDHVLYLTIRNFEGEDRLRHHFGL